MGLNIMFLCCSGSKDPGSPPWMCTPGYWILHIKSGAPWPHTAIVTSPDVICCSGNSNPLLEPSIMAFHIPYSLYPLYREFIGIFPAITAFLIWKAGWPFRAPFSPIQVIWAIRFHGLLWHYLLPCVCFHTGYSTAHLSVCGSQVRSLQATTCFYILLSITT